MRFCCDEQCEQGRDCPAHHPLIVDWVDGFALGVCATALVAILVMVLV